LSGSSKALVHGAMTGIFIDIGLRYANNSFDRWFTFCKHSIVHVITRRVLKEFAAIHKGAEKPLDSWYSVAKKARWQSIADVRVNYPHADAVDKCTVFNIGGNKYRLIVKIEYKLQTIYIKHVLTHVEYDKEDWKRDC
jgi:mRNA interferase HigB